MPKAKGGQPYQEKSTPTISEGVETLANLGISYKQSSEWQGFSPWFHLVTTEGLQLGPSSPEFSGAVDAGVSILFFRRRGCPPFARVSSRCYIPSSRFFGKKSAQRFLRGIFMAGEGTHLPQDAPLGSGWWGRLPVFAGGFQGHGVVSHCRLILTGKLSAVFRWRG